MTNEMATAKKTDKPSSTYAATNNTIADGPAPQSNNLRADGPEMTDDEKTLRRIFLAAGAVPVVKLTDIRASGGSSKGHKMTVTELTQHKFKQLCDLAAAKGWGSAEPMAPHSALSAGQIQEGEQEVAQGEAQGKHHRRKAMGFTKTPYANMGEVPRQELKNLKIPQSLFVF